MTRNKQTILFLAYFITACAALCALGKKEEEEKKPQNDEWILCITAFDSDSLPADRQGIAAVISRSLVDTLKVVRQRIRVSPEYAYYEGYAWSRQRAAAAKALAAKQDERALLLYRGDPEWKYKLNLKNTGAEIEKLREAYEKTETDTPLVNREPAFSLAQANSDGTYPSAPKAGEEYRFCQGQKADAFLAGTVREYHGRYYVTLRLYAVYTRSFIYEDDILFSADDLDAAVEEIAGSLIAVLAGSKPAALSVSAQPPDTLVLINRRFAGRGEAEAKEYPPGKAVVTFSAPYHESETVETSLAAGELAEISVNLRPSVYGNVTVAVPGSADVSVYQGAMYVGKAPLTLRLPLGRLEYVNVEAPGGKAAKMAFAAPESAAAAYTFNMRPRIPPSVGQQRVNNARRWYYWAWGGTWLTGIAAWIFYGMYQTHNAVPQGQPVSENYGEENKRMYNITGIAAGVVGAAVLYEIFQIGRYLYIATEDTTPIEMPSERETIK